MRNSKLILMTACVFFLAGSCNIVVYSKSKVHRENKLTDIVYVAFDSLEQELCKEISFLKNQDSVCIMIEPAGNFSYSIQRNVSGRYIYRIGKYYQHYYPQDSIIIKSNRRMKICNKLYPVYLRRVDDVFSVEEERKNVPFRDNVLPENYDLYCTGFIVVDMANKIILSSSYR